FEYTRMVTWWEANIACVNLNAHLAAIESEAEQNYLNLRINSFGYKKRGGMTRHLWIGGNNLAGGGWKWAAAGLGFTSKPMEYTYWRSGQPDYSDNTKNCVYIDGRPDTYTNTWNNINCACDL
ncbi:unnamed protein product, partial [Owenia fusiformis]